MSRAIWRHGRLPPVGQRATTETSGHAAALRLAGFRCLPLASGTAALALALHLARARRPDIAQPQALLPGYACPDLLAAAHWAGVTPVLVDIGADDHALDRADLAGRCTPHTVAVVAVNLLGIADELTALRAFSDERELLLIEDDAQWLPEPWDGATPRGDCVVLSFGRGKPVPLVGGGALLVRADIAADELLPSIAPASSSRWPLPWQIAAYNAALHRRAYGLLAALPGLHLGATRYQPLRELAALDAARDAGLAPNLHRQLRRSREREQWIRELVLPRCPAGTIDLPLRCGARAQRLLRYPLLLADEPRRDVLFVALAAAGLGASRMYERVLPEVAGVPRDVDCPPLPNARRFAARLLTLPVHAGVRRDDVRRMADIAHAMS